MALNQIDNHYPSDVQTPIPLSDSTTASVATDKCSYIRVAKKVAKARLAREMWMEMTDLEITTNEVTDLEAQILGNFKSPKLKTPKTYLRWS